MFEIGSYNSHKDTDGKATDNGDKATYTLDNNFHVICKTVQYCYMLKYENSNLKI